jgi:RNA polymerase sigma factor (sigma-70 family)
MEVNDEALVRACRRGDAAAWEALVMRYQRLIYAIARRAGLDREQSAEAFQNVFVALVERLDRIEHPALLGAWLATAARYEVWRVRRRIRAVAALDLDNPSHAEELLDDTPLDGALLQLEEQNHIRKAVAALDERCRILVTLLFYRADPPSYTEIAVLLGMSEGSIGPTRARCLTKVRRLLEDIES